MTRTLTYHLSNTSLEIPLTVKGFLKSKDYSTQNLKIIKQLPDGILLNGAPAHMNARLNSGDILTVQIKEEVSSENIVPVKLPLNIVYEDEDLLVVNKPAGMPIHPSQNNYDNTLANALAYYFQQKGVSFVFRCIGRCKAFCQCRNLRRSRCRQDATNQMSVFHSKGSLESIATKLHARVSCHRPRHRHALLRHDNGASWPKARLHH